MPIRVYRCPNCNRVEENIEGKDVQGCVCNDCKIEMDKLPTASNFHLKGKGWYVTDYKKSGGGKKGD